MEVLKGSLGRPWSRWEDSIKMDLRIVWEDVDKSSGSE
jgi:hypothetical protein